MICIYVRGDQYKVNYKSAAHWKLLGIFPEGEFWKSAFSVAKMHYGKENVIYREHD